MHRQVLDVRHDQDHFQSPSLSLSNRPAAIWPHYTFALSLRGVDDMLAERWIDVWYETIRRWTCKLDPASAKRIRLRRPRSSIGSIWT
jgi:transposase-like protein